MNTRKRLSIVLACVAIVAMNVELQGQTLNDPNRSLNLFYSYTNAGSGSGADDLAIGNGGAYGTDLYVADFGTYGANNGRVWRIADANNDGLGEGSVFSSAATNGYKSPISLAFGKGGVSPLGNDLYTLDYNNSISLRHVYRVNGSGVATQHSTLSTFNPDGLAAHPDGQRIILHDASTFTVFGGGDDGTLFQVNSSGTRTVWADGSNNANGLWDINTDGVFSSDGWYTLNNHGVTTNHFSEIIQFKDVNLDGDANDAGESRVLIGLGAPVGAALAFDSLGNLYNAQSNDVYRYTDLNNDGDFWDTLTGTFDVGEQFLFAEDLGARIDSLIYDANKDTFFVGAFESNGSTSIYRISAAVPEPSALSFLVLLSVGCLNRRKRKQ